MPSSKKCFAASVKGWTVSGWILTTELLRDRTTDRRRIRISQAAGYLAGTAQKQQRYC
jgi:hypothetical protein